jgi:hypothetical protein
MRTLQVLLLAAIVMPLAAFAAAESESKASDNEQFRAINPQIDSWALGTISNVDAKTGQITVRGSQLPFATAHAQMRQELRTKLANVADRAERAKVAAQVRKEWNDKLQAAMGQKAEEAKDFTFKVPADADDLVILNASDVRELPAFQRMQARREQRMAHVNEAAALESTLSEGAESGSEATPTTYKADRAEAAREKAGEAREKMTEKAGDVKEKAKERMADMTPEQRQKLAARGAERREERREKRKARIMAGREKLESEELSLSDLKNGDQVFVGFDKDSNSVYSLVRRDAGAAHPVSHERKPEPATAK